MNPTQGGHTFESLRQMLNDAAEREAEAGQWETCAATLRLVLALCPDPLQISDAMGRQIAALRRVVIKRTLRRLAVEGLIRG